jgi:hypothetical protein
MSLRTTSECLHYVTTTANASASFTVVPAVGILKVGIYRMLLTIGSPAVTVQLKDTAGGVLSQPFQLSANGTIAVDTQENLDPWWITGSGLGVVVTQTGTTPIGLDLYYLQGP